MILTTQYARENNIPFLVYASDHRLWRLNLQEMYLVSRMIKREEFAPE